MLLVEGYVFEFMELLMGELNGFVEVKFVEDVNGELEDEL